MTNPRRNPTEHPVLDAIARRWSPVGFDASPVPRDVLLRILEAARWAASSNNEQPWRFVVGPREDRAQFERVLSTLVPGNQVWAQHAGALILVCTKSNFTYKDRPNPYAWFDAGQALAHLFLQTIAEGLHAHAMGGFEKEKARETFVIPEGFEPVCAVAIGRHDPAAPLPEDTAARDHGPRSRRALAEIVFGERFGAASALVKQ